jgi:hypothetical protein
MGGGSPDVLVKPPKQNNESPNLMNRLFRGEVAESRELAGKWVFMSPIGQSAEFITRYMASLWEMPEFRPGPEDGAFIQTNWRKFQDEFYRADLVLAQGNTLDSASFERFVGYFGGVAASLRSSYEDALEAMKALSRRMQAFASDRVGMRAAGTLRDQLLEEFRQRSVVRHSTEGFSLRAIVAP